MSICSELHESEVSNKNNFIAIFDIKNADKAISYHQISPIDEGIKIN